MLRRLHETMASASRRLIGRGFSVFPPRLQCTPENYATLRLTRSPRAWRACGRRWWRQYFQYLRLPGSGSSVGEVSRLVLAIASAAKFNGCIRHVSCPGYCAAIDEVVGTTGQTPVADGWIQRDGVAVEYQRPIGWRKGRDHFLAAAARAAMNGGSAIHRDVQHARREFRWDFVYENVRHA